MPSRKFTLNQIIKDKNHEFGIVRDFDLDDDNEVYYIEFLDLSSAGVLTNRYRWINGVDLSI